MFWQRSAPTRRRIIALCPWPAGTMAAFPERKSKNIASDSFNEQIRSGAESNCGLGNPFYSAPSNHGTPEPRSIVADATVERWWEEINVYQEV